MTRIQSSNAGPAIQQTTNSNTVESNQSNATNQKTGNVKPVDQFETKPAATNGSKNENGNTQATAATPELSSELSRRMMESKGLVRDARVPAEKPFLLDQSMPEGPASKMPEVNKSLDPIGGQLKTSEEKRTGFEEQTNVENRNPIEGFENNKPIGPDINQMIEGVQVGGLDGRTPDGALVNPNERGSGSVLDGNPQGGLVSVGNEQADVVDHYDGAVHKYICPVGSLVYGIDNAAYAAANAVSKAAKYVAEAVSDYVSDEKTGESTKEKTENKDSEVVRGGRDSDSDQMSVEPNESQTAGSETQSSSEASVEPAESQPSDGGVTDQESAGGVPDTGQGDPDNPDGALSGKEKQKQLDKLLGGLDEHEMRVKFQTKFGGAIDPADESSGSVASGAQGVTDPTPLVAIYDPQNSRTVDETTAGEDITAEAENRQSWEYDNSPEQ